MRVLKTSIPRCRDGVFDFSKNIKFRKISLTPLMQIHCRLYNLQHEVEVPGEDTRAVDPVDGDDLHRGEGEDEDGAPVVVHHLQHDLPARRHVEQPDPVT